MVRFLGGDDRVFLIGSQDLFDGSCRLLTRQCFNVCYTFTSIVRGNKQLQYLPEKSERGTLSNRDPLERVYQFLIGF